MLALISEWIDLLLSNWLSVDICRVPTLCYFTIFKFLTYDNFKIVIFYMSKYSNRVKKQITPDEKLAVNLW